MPDITAAQSGSFRIGGETPVHRLGFGAMRITGAGIWGPPEDRDEAIRTLKRLPELGIDFIDTANSYGPDVSEALIREALHPYAGTGDRHQGGADPERAEPLGPEGRPGLSDRRGRAQPREARGRADRPLAAAPDRRQGAARRAVRSGEVADRPRGDPLRRPQRGHGRGDRGGAAGVSRWPPCRTATTSSTAPARRCSTSARPRASASCPGHPLAAGALARPGSVLSDIAARLGLAPGQVALAWVLQRSPVMLPIPGTSKVSHLEENVASAGDQPRRGGLRRARQGGAGAASGGVRATGRHCDFALEVER